MTPLEAQIDEVKKRVRELLGKGYNVILEAYPGWGKTRLAAHLAGEYDRVVIVERTIEEVREVASMASVKLIPLYGKEKVCPFIRSGARGPAFYRECRNLRLLGLCKFQYEVEHRLVRFAAGRFREPEEIKKAGADSGRCPYPSLMLLSDSKKIVTTYGFVFSHPGVLKNRSLVVFDESHEMMSAVLEHMEVYDELEVHALAEGMKKNIETRNLAYAVRQCWRKSRTFREFAECLERLPYSHESVDRIVALYRSKRSYVAGKMMVHVPRTIEVIPPSGCLFMTAYTPPFILDMIPNAERVAVVPPPELKVDVLIDDSATSRYEERGEETYKAYAEKILDYYSAGDANLVLFPSYEFMENVKKHLPQEFLERVKPRDAIREVGEGDVVFDVAGGTSSEGVNPSPHLRRVIVAGMPYPPPSPEMNALARVYGFDNTYTYVSLLRVVQAIGRLRFRRGADAILVDRRFRAVAKYFPPYFALR